MEGPARIGSKGSLEPVALRRSIEGDTRNALIAAVIQFGIVAAVIGAVVGAALPWRGRGSVIGGAVVGGGGAVGLAAAALPGFNGQRFGERALLHISVPTRPEPISYAVFWLKKKKH